MSTKAIPESTLLKPRDPSLDKDSDTWPEFELKDVKVYLPGDPAAITSLLEATEHYTLSLTGYLEPVSEDQSHLRLQSVPCRAPLIEVTDVNTFSFGQYEGGNIGLWAGGKAGWFQLSPSRGYRSIWNEMVESVNLFYWIADAYREKRKRGNYKTAPLLPDYTPREVFEKYAAEELGDGARASDAAKKMHKYRNFLMSSMIGGKEGISWTKKPLYLYLVEEFPEDHAIIKSRITGVVASSRSSRQPSINSDTASLKRKRGRLAKNQAPDGPSHGASSVAEDEARTSRQGRSSATQSQSTAATRSRKVGGKAAISETPEADRVAHTSDDDKPEYATKGRSALRPKPTKASKGASKGGKAPVPDTYEDEEDELASSPTIARQHEESRTTAQPRPRSRKPDVDEGIDMPSSPGSENPSSAGSDAALDAIEGEDDHLAAAAKVNHVPDPVQEDTWVCGLDGCSHKVYRASTADSQRLIRDHYVLHAYDDDDRVQMVKKLQHPSLPVNHLMEKVRFQAMMEGFPGSDAAADGPGAHSRYQPLPVVKY